MAAFDRKGEYIFTGNAKGKVLQLNQPFICFSNMARISKHSNFVIFLLNFSIIQTVYGHKVLIFVKYHEMLLLNIYKELYFIHTMKI